MAALKGAAEMLETKNCFPRTSASSPPHQADRYLTELWLALPSLPGWLLDDLKCKHGIGSRKIALVGDLRFAAVSIAGGEFFELDDEGEPALIVPAWYDPPSPENHVADPFLIDLLAFQIEDPCRWWLYRADAAMLGEAVLREARFFREPLPVHRHPLSWLKWGGCGVMPIDWSSFAIAVSGCPPIELVAEDLEHGEEIRRNLGAGLLMPRISVKTS